VKKRRGSCVSAVLPFSLIAPPAAAGIRMRAMSETDEQELNKLAAELDSHVARAAAASGKSSNSSSTSCSNSSSSSSISIFGEQEDCQQAPIVRYYSHGEKE
jgi:hypothetical protein